MDINQMKYLLVKTLGEITVMGKPVDVLTEFPPGKRLPSIGMSNHGGEGHIETLVHKKISPLPSNHPYFDPQAPKTLHHTEDVYIDVFKNKILLHIWCESNEERDILVKKVKAKLLKDKNNHFKDDLHAQLINIGSKTDVDQFDSFPPLYHTTIVLDFIYYMVYSVEVGT